MADIITPTIDFYSTEKSIMKISDKLSHENIASIGERIMSTLKDGLFQAAKRMSTDRENEREKLFGTVNLEKENFRKELQKSLRYKIYPSEKAENVEYLNMLIAHLDTMEQKYPVQPSVPSDILDLTSFFEELSHNITDSLTTFLDNHLKSDRYSVLEAKKKIRDKLYLARDSTEEFRRSYDMAARFRESENLNSLIKEYDHKYDEERNYLTNKLKEKEYSVNLLSKQIKEYRADIMSLQNDNAIKDHELAMLNDMLKNLPSKKASRNGSPSSKSRTNTPKITDRKTLEKSQTESFLTTIASPVLLEPCRNCPKYEESLKQLETKYDNLEKAYGDMRKEYNHLLNSSKDLVKEKEKEKEREKAIQLEKTKVEEQMKAMMDKFNAEIKILKEQGVKMTTQIEKMKDRELELEKMISDANEKNEEEMLLREAELEKAFSATLNEKKIEWEANLEKERNALFEKQKELEEKYKTERLEMINKLKEMETTFANEKNLSKDKISELEKKMSNQKNKFTERESSLVKKIEELQNQLKKQAKELERLQNEITSANMSHSLVESESSVSKQTEENKNLLDFAVNELNGNDQSPSRPFSPFGINNTVGIIKERMSATPTPVPTSAKSKPRSGSAKSPKSPKNEQHKRDKDDANMNELIDKQDSFYENIDGSTYLQMLALDEENENQLIQFSKEEKRIRSLSSPMVKILKTPSSAILYENFQKEQQLTKELNEKNLYLQQEVEKLVIKLKITEQINEKKEKVLNLKLKESSILLHEFSNQTISLRKEMKTMSTNIQKLQSTVNSQQNEHLPKIKIIDLNNKINLNNSFSDSVLNKSKTMKGLNKNENVDKYLFKDAISDEILKELKDIRDEIKKLQSSNNQYL